MSPTTTLERVLSARDVAALTPTVVCAQEGSTFARLPVRAARGSWPTGVHTDPVAAAHATSLRDPRLVLVGGTSLGWVLQAVRTLRRSGPHPIAVAGTPVAAEDVLALLGAGASLVVEPTAHPRELVARLVGLVTSAAGDDGRVRWLQADGLRLDLQARRCTLDGETVALTTTEHELLALLMGRAQQVVPHHELITHLWGWRHENADNTLRLHVGRLRRKLADRPSAPRWIASVRGAGYRFVPAVAELGEDRAEDRMRQQVAQLNAQSDALRSLVDTLAAAGDAAAVAETVVQWAVSRGFGDAATVFRLDAAPDGTARSTLVASAGMSARWRQSVATGHPVADGFMGAHVYSSGEPVQLSDMTRWARRFPVTARMSSAEDLHACLLFPLHVDGRVWGDLAFVSRTDRAFTPARSAYLRTVAGVVSLAVTAHARHVGGGRVA